MCVCQNGRRGPVSPNFVLRLTKYHSLEHAGVRKVRIIGISQNDNTGFVNAVVTGRRVSFMAMILRLKFNTTSVIYPRLPARPDIWVYLLGERRVHAKTIHTIKKIPNILPYSPGVNSRNCRPSCFLRPLKTTHFAGMLTPIANVSVANSTRVRLRANRISTSYTP